MPTKFLKCFILIYLSVLYTAYTQAQSPKIFKVMAWNILHGANDIENGRENAINIIKAIDPDIVLMVETYGSGKIIADSLGYNFHLVAPEGTALDDERINLSIFSRFPFGDRIDTGYPFYLGGSEVIIGKQKIRAFSNWFHYEPWSDAPEELGKTVDELLEWEKTGKKYEMLQKVLPYFRQYTAEADSIPVIIGGDMNAPSHLDWGESTKDLHHGLVVPWYTTKVLAETGLIDSYRTIHPDPISHTGITWDQKNKKDEHRIDYIFYKGPLLKPIDSQVYQVFFNEPFEIGGQKIMYPSDHGIVVSTFKIFE